VTEMIKSKLHLYAQTWEHQPAYVVGDRDALERLKQAIEIVLEDNGRSINSSVIPAFATDGEGYDVHVVLLEEQADWYKLQMPYTGDSESDGSAGKLWPEEMFGVVGRR
jgi:hypothetical protein